MTAQAGPWWCALAQTPAQTCRVAERLAGALEAGDVVTLAGGLGAGKTTFVKGLARGLGAHPDDVVSPTFQYVREVRGGRLPLFHVDCYRLLPRAPDFGRPPGPGFGPSRVAGFGPQAAPDLSPQPVPGPGAQPPEDRRPQARIGPEELDLDYYLTAGGVVAIEWPEPVQDWLPDERFEVVLEVAWGERGARATSEVQGQAARTVSPKGDVPPGPGPQSGTGPGPWAGREPARDEVPARRTIRIRGRGNRLQRVVGELAARLGLEGPC